MYQKLKNWYIINKLCTKKAIFGTRLNLCIFCTSSNGRINKLAQIKKDTSLRKAILQAAVTGKLISTVVEPAETTIETGRQLLDRIIEERNKKVLEETKKNHTDLQIFTKSADAKIDSRSKSQISVTKGYISSYIFKEVR